MIDLVSKVCQNIFMSKFMSLGEQRVAAYYDDSSEVLLDPYAALSPAEKASYKAYERYWRYEVKRFGKMLCDKKVLSLGTGTAADAAMFREQGIDYVGIDISENVLRGAISRIPRPTVARMNMRHLGFADNSFGGVWSFDSSSYVSKDHIGDVLSEAHRVLRPRGLLYINTLLGDGLSYEGGFGNVQHWQPAEFEQRLRDADFRVTNLRTEGPVGSSSTFIAQAIEN